MEKLLVAKTTEIKNLAGAIANMIRQGQEVTMQAIGAAATNQAVKAVATAGIFLMPNGIRVAAEPAFTAVEINGEERTAITMKVVAIQEEKR